MLLFYIRHGDPIYTPNSLTPLGERQAESVAKRLALYGIDEVYSSTSNRAVQTAKPTCEITKNELVTLDFANESYAYGELAAPLPDGKKRWVFAHPDYRDLMTSKEIKSMGDRWYEHPALAELHLERGIERIRKESLAWLSALGYEYDEEKGMYKITTDNTEKRVALFAHEGFGKVFLSTVLDIPYPCFASHFELNHTGMTVICFDDNGKQGDERYSRAHVLTLSNDSHLYRDGLPTKYISTGMRNIY